jgi:hypothetical protein
MHFRDGRQKHNGQWTIPKFRLDRKTNIFRLGKSNGVLGTGYDCQFRKKPFVRGLNKLVYIIYYNKLQTLRKP